MIPEGECRKLWYVVHGDTPPRPSKVPTYTGHEIEALQRAINVQRRDIPVSDMVLWKVRLPAICETAPGWFSMYSSTFRYLSTVVQKMRRTLSLRALKKFVFLIKFLKTVIFSALMKLGMCPFTGTWIPHQSSCMLLYKCDVRFSLFYGF